MYAINHAATALVLKKHNRDVSWPWLLASVQLVEVFWVVLNFVGVERTTTEDKVTYVGDIHLTHMPFSHSVVAVLGVAAVSWWLISRFLDRPQVARVFAVGVVSHLVLDLVTHSADIALMPFVDGPMLGLGLYAALPLVGFALETAYGVWCWWYYGGSKKLLAVIVGFNLANITMFVPQVVGIEGLLAHRPTLITVVIAAQIAVTLYLVGKFGRHAAAGPLENDPSRSPNVPPHLAVSPTPKV